MSSFLDKLKILPGAISKGDEAITPYLRDTMLEGDPEVVLRPRDITDLKEILRHCRTDKIPMTICGARTSMTGASVALSGVLVSTENLRKIIGITDNDKCITATAETGLPLIEFKNHLAENGLFYPMHPTSVNDVYLGATVATNATGDDTYKYGPTRRWVRRIKVLLIDGREITLERPKDSRPEEIKSKGGYYMHGPEIDRFIGSEGTLGIITEVTVDLLRGVPEFYSIMIPFPSNMDALEFITRAAVSKIIQPRSLEFIDSTGVGIMKTKENFSEQLGCAGAIVYSNTEYEPERFEENVAGWLEELSAFGLSQELTDKAVIAASRKEKDEMHSWRHHIPEWINETYRKCEAEGGGKVGGDWWVPMQHMLSMMEWFYKVSGEAEMPFIAYAHLGNGHPHTNYFTRNSDERNKAKQLVIEACRKAVSYGGGVAGEHGIGKIKRHLLSIQHPQKIINEMRALKSHYDPDWILGRGNIFELPFND